MAPAGERRVVRRDDLRRTYRREHPVALFFALGVALAGAGALVYPAGADQSAVSVALPDWLRHIFDLIYLVGGSLAAGGIGRRHRRSEAAGLILIAAGLAAQFSAVLYVRPQASVSATFIASTALGCTLRAWRLTRRSF